MAQKVEKGLFITFEGPEGCGKSTQSRRICEELRAEGYDVIHTVEPGGTSLGQNIRALLLEKESIELSRKAEILLFETDRAQHVEQIIVPALLEGKIVICDRYNTATFAYQGYGLGADMEFIKKIDDAVTGGLEPHLTVLMDIDVETGLKRAGNTGVADRMEKRDLKFHEKVRAGYLDLAEKYPKRIRVIKVNDGIDEVYRLVRKQVYDIVERYKRSE